MSSPRLPLPFSELSPYPQGPGEDGVRPRTKIHSVPQQNPSPFFFHTFSGEFFPRAKKGGSKWVGSRCRSREPRKGVTTIMSLRRGMEKWGPRHPCPPTTESVVCVFRPLHTPSLRGPLVFLTCRRAKGDSEVGDGSYCCTWWVVRSCGISGFGCRPLFTSPTTHGPGSGRDCVCICVCVRCMFLRTSRGRVYSTFTLIGLKLWFGVYSEVIKFWTPVDLSQRRLKYPHLGKNFNVFLYKFFMVKSVKFHKPRHRNPCSCEKTLVVVVGKSGRV